MADITIKDLTAGTPILTDLLIFANPTTGLAKKATLTTFKSSLSLYFADLNDYAVANLLDEQFLIYDSGEWKNTSLKTINGNNLFGSGNIVISGGSGLTSLNALTASTQTFATSSTGTDFTITSASSTHTFNLPSASAANRGLLTAANWTTFNNKQAALVSGTNIVTLGGLSLLQSGNYGFSITTNGLTLLFEAYSYGFGAQGINLNIPIASPTIANGLLTSTDWTTFNNKQPLLVSGTNIKTVNGTSLLGSGNIVISGGTGLTSLNALTSGTQLFAIASTGTDFAITSASDTHTFAIPTASASARGLLSAANWTTFNSKQDALSGTGFVKSTEGTISYDTSTYLTANQSITLSGDVSGSGATAITTTLATVTQASSGNFVKVTLDTKGRVTGNTAVLAADITALGFASSLITTNRQTASYTLVLADANKLVELNVATANTLTVPLNSSVAFPIGTQILVSQYGAGACTITAASGVTVRSEGSKLKTNGQYSGATLIKIAENEWYAFGNLIV